jgi:hypothetical protein
MKFFLPPVGDFLRDNKKGPAGCRAYCRQLAEEETLTSSGFFDMPTFF